MPVYRRRRLNFDRLQIINGLSCQGAVKRVLQRVPRKLEGHAGIFAIDQDAPAAVIHANEVDAGMLCKFVIHRNESMVQ